METGVRRSRKRETFWPLGLPRRSRIIDILRLATSDLETRQVPEMELANQVDPFFVS